MIQKTSEKMSFEGWEFAKWAKGNLKTIKEAVKVGAPLILAMPFFAQNPVILGVVTIIGKAILDAADFYFTEVKL
ncbi:MAG TPA: hypothetical protein VMV32_00775 [Ignavibacteriaceae bacterium]|nr:hypothetical protein [Ignavibacteriaceae bacterium]